MHERLHGLSQSPQPLGPRVDLSFLGDEEAVLEGILGFSRFPPRKPCRVPP
jgi:hypothetical protein